MKKLIFAVFISVTITLLAANAETAKKEDWKWDKYGIEKTDNLDAIPTPYKKGSWENKEMAQIKKTPYYKWGIGTIMLGDSITAGWRWSPKAKKAPKILKDLASSIGSGKIYSFAISGSETKHVLWRLTEGNIIDKKLRPSVVTLMIGVNNILRRKDEASITNTADGIKNILTVIKKRYPRAKILLFGVLPHFGKKFSARAVKLNKLIKKYADFEKVYFLDMSDKFGENGKEKKALFYDGIHPNDEGYQLWADTMKPYLKDLLKNNGEGEIWEALKEKYLTTEKE